MGRFLTKNYDAPSVRHTTCEAHRYVLKNHILPWIGDCPLESLTTQKIEEFLEEHQLHGNKRNGKPLSQQTMRHIQNLLSKVLSQAVNRGLIERNPVQGICRSAPKQVKATILADNEIRDYLSAAKDFHKLTERVLMEDLYDRTPHFRPCNHDTAGVRQEAFRKYRPSFWREPEVLMREPPAPTVSVFVP